MMNNKKSKILQALWLVFFMLAGSSPGYAFLQIEKATNGFDADVAPGPDIIEGSVVTWTYVVTNVDDGSGRTPTIFNVNVSDDQGVVITCDLGTNVELAGGDQMHCMGSGIATLGQYANIGTATGDGVDPVSDPSHYNGIPAPSSAITIETLTNGVDSDTAPGQTLTTGDAVNWSYVLNNTGGSDLNSVAVNDDQGVSVSCPSTTLVSGATMTCTASGTVIDGQYMNTGSVTALDPSGDQVFDSDPSHYLGFCQISVDIVKKTNNVDHAAAPGDELTIGDPVTWQYEVSNTGLCNLLNVGVTDDQGIVVSCPSAFLAPGDSMTCTGAGTVTTLGQYTNVGTVNASDRLRNTIQAQDSSFYFGLAEGATLAAVAGPDQSVDEGASVALDGTGSVIRSLLSGSRLLAPMCLRHSSASIPQRRRSTPLTSIPPVKRLPLS